MRRALNILTISILLATLYSFTSTDSKVDSLKDGIGLSDYCQGWKDGYCEGWKDVKGQLTICPIPPICPIPKLECDRGYKCGYNRGFKAGMKAATED